MELVVQWDRQPVEEHPQPGTPRNDEQEARVEEKGPTHGIMQSQYPLAV